MEFIAAGYEIIEQKPGLKGVYKAIEYPGRICYGSTDKMRENSAEEFVHRLEKANHGAPMEHGAVYLHVKKSVNMTEWLSPSKESIKFNEMNNFYTDNPYSKVNIDSAAPYEESSGDEKYDLYDHLYISTNYRVLFENNRLDDLKYLCEPTEHHEKRIMVKFTIDRFTGEEFLRHRKASFNRESTRYITFTKEKFGGGSIKFILPPWLKESDNGELISDEQEEKIWNMNNNFEEMCGQIFNLYSNGELEDTFKALDYWIFALKATEWSYNNLVNKCNWQAQQARTVLPCAINSPLIMTAFISDWIHFFKLRALGTTGVPHPQAKELAEPLMNEFVQLGLIEKIN